MTERSKDSYIGVLGRRDRLPFLTALLTGLLAHGFFLTNKIPVDDDLPFFFGKGATTISGRWGLELLRLVLPDYSMPWLYGLLSLLVLSVCACMIVVLFDIRNPFLKALLAAVFVSFPAETGTISYTFTSLPYAIALGLAIGAVCAYRGGGWQGFALAVAMLLLSCAIYQGYFAFAASFCVLLLLQELLRGEKSSGEVIREGLRMLGMLVLAAGLYGLSILLVNRLLHLPVLAKDVVNTRQSLLMRFALCYSAFLHTLTRGYFAYVRGSLSRLLHVLLALLVLWRGARLLRGRPVSHWLLAGLLLFLLPPAAYCLYMLADTGYIHSLALYSFVGVYVLAALVLDGETPAWDRKLAALSLTVILAGNVTFANAFSLCCQMEFEQARSFAVGLVTRVQMTPGYDTSCPLALFGEATAGRSPLRERFGLDGFALPGNNITRTIQLPELSRLYLGWELPLASEEERQAIRDSGLLAEMPPYPADGSVVKVGDTVVVKLSD